MSSFSTELKKFEQPTHFGHHDVIKEEFDFKLVDSECVRNVIGLTKELFFLNSKKKQNLSQKKNQNVNVRSVSPVNHLKVFFGVNVNSIW